MTTTQSPAEFHFNQASSLEERRDFQAALEECDASLGLNPRYADAHNLRGMILERLTRREEALLAYREALRLEPKFREARDNLRDAEEELLQHRYRESNTEGRRFAIRAAAYVIDVALNIAINLVVLVAVGFALGVALAISPRELRFDEQRVQNVGFVVQAVASVLYFAVFEWLYGATPGKLLLGMRVVHRNGEPCGLGAALIRGLLRYFDILFFGIVAYAIMKAPMYQRAGDRVARTIVVGAKDGIVQRPRPRSRFVLALALFLALEAAAISISLLAGLR